MRCPQCDRLNTTVIDTRDFPRRKHCTRRRRRCQGCDHRFTTFELRSEDVIFRTKDKIASSRAVLSEASRLLLEAHQKLEEL